MTTSLEPLWADVHATSRGRRRLGHLQLPISGRDVLVRLEPTNLLVGERREVLYQLAADDVYAVHWHGADDVDQSFLDLQLNPYCPSHILDLTFHPRDVGIEGVIPGSLVPMCWLNDWLCIPTTYCRLVSIPRHWVPEYLAHVA